MSLKIIDLNDRTTFGLGIEELEVCEDIHNSSGVLGRIIERMTERVRYLPQITFEMEDVNEDVIREMFKYPELLKVVETWIMDTDYMLLPQLQEAKKVFESIQKPKPYKTLYRGFSIKQDLVPTPGQPNMEKMRIGDTYKFTLDRPTSFSFHKGTANKFGDVVVSVDYDKEKDRMFHITNEIVLAYLISSIKNYKLDNGIKLPTYGESVFLPDGKPIQFTLVQKAE